MKYFIYILLLSCSIIGFNQTEKKKTTFEITESVTKTDVVHIDGKKISYEVTAGYLTLKSEYGEEQAHLFFISYTKTDVADITKRPITFSFNGGPGSSSVWMHLGMLGPKRVKMTDEGYPEKPPYALINNDYSWLDKTDLVFIDPISTGFSRAEEQKKAKDYHGFKGDINSVGNFIRRYVSDNKRWASPKYLIGESYGTLRAAALSKHLISSYGMYLNGTILVSYVNNFQTISFGNGNDLPYTLFLPSYSAAAHYHKQLTDSLQNKPLTQVLKQVEDFSINKYSVALLKGNNITAKEKDNIAQQMSIYTGLSKDYILKSNLRINVHKFRKELLRDSLQAIGRFDGRYVADDISALSHYAETDPSFTPTVQGPYSTLINDYLTRDLGFKTHLPYEVLTGKVWPWDYSSFENEYVNVASHLRKAMIQNPEMKVWIANGYYDLATPYFATEHTINHINLPSKQKKNLKLTYHKAGHMMYLHLPSLQEMKNEAVLFYDEK